MSAGIPTYGPRGIRFRSRLTAQWAHVFQALGWSWEYEPLDLGGYVPDFVLSFERQHKVREFPDAHVLVAVQACVNIEDKAAHQPILERIWRSGWKGPVLVVGARPHPRHDHQASIVGVGRVAIDTSDPRGLVTGTYGLDPMLVDEIEVRRVNNIWYLGGEQFAYDLWHPAFPLPMFEPILDRVWKYADRSWDDFDTVWCEAKNLVLWSGDASPEDRHLSLEAPEGPMQRF
jgi:hypothetical protein